MANRGPALGPEAQSAIASPESEVFVSAVIAWEISIKGALGKIEAPEDLEEQLQRHHFMSLDISLRHAIKAGALPSHHDDSFDRMLVAQALAENLGLSRLTVWASVRGEDSSCEPVRQAQVTRVFSGPAAKHASTASSDGLMGIES